MKKIYVLILSVFLFVGSSLAQVTVTNPGNTTPVLAATYPSLAAAITALNTITVISGPVTITLNASQTAPAGGYVIQFTATTTTTNKITLEGNSNIITASNALTVGLISDCIFKLVGVDYITLQHFTMQENAANTVNTPVSSNNMTEWGVALLRSSITNGAQNNTIQNNTISLNRAYRNSFGIYSNTRHTAANTSLAPLTFEDPTAVSGSNSGNKIYANSISNVNLGITFIGSSNAGFMDVGNDIGGSAVATGNTITNWGGNVHLSSYVSNDNSSYCIYSNHQTADNISYNTIISGTNVGAGINASFTGINKSYSSTAPTGAFTSTISYNTITLSSAFNSSTSTGILSYGMGTLAAATLNITNNNIIDFSVTANTGIDFYGIRNTTSAPGILNITNNIIRGLTTVSAVGFTGILNTGNTVNTININNNKIGDAVAAAATYSNAAVGALNAISNTGGASTATVNINNNSIDRFSVVNFGAINFIQNTAGNVAAVNINNNQLGTVTGSLISFSGAQAVAYPLTGIYNPNGNSSMLVSIQNNDFRGIVNTLTCAANQQYIYNQAQAFATNISNNTFTNLSINSNTSVYLIFKGGIMASGASSTITNNSIVGSFSKTVAGGTVQLYSSSGASVSGSSVTVSGNNFSNVSVLGSSLYGVYDVEGVSAASGPTKTYTGNTISNFSSGGNTGGVLVDKAENLSITSNTISNISATGFSSVTGIQYGSTPGAGTHDVSLNNINSLSSASDVWGISGSSSGPLPINVHDNIITGLSSSGANRWITGIYHSNGQTVNIYNNNINNISGSGAGTGVTYGIWINGGTTTNIYRNNITGLLHSGAVTSSPAVNGILISNGTTVTAYNNFISGLNASTASSTDAIRGISVTSTTASTNYNFYYNSIYFNASSTGTNFGTSGIYHTSNAIATTAALNMINNIVVNTSTPKNTGLTAAYRRSSSILDNYASSSNNNLFYAGTPSATRLIFYDGTNSDSTLAAYKTRVSPKDSNSISAMPAFVSTTNLHLTTANCQVNARGIPVAGITNDIDLDARHATTPDIGADEFTAGSSTVLAGVAGSAICENRPVAVTGTIYTSNACDLIARVVPSGGEPVAGNINVCVTLDATQQYFNGEPYVQRHYDLEPVTSNQTSTSATVTLYFTNAEFALYNTTNLVWPPLPTIAGGGMGDPAIANVKVTQFHGTPTGGLPTTTPGNYTGTRVLLTPTSVVLNGNTWEVTVNIMGFSGFYVHTNIWGSPLPISVNYFTGVKQGSDHLLNWKVTCNSTTRVTMELERGTDSRNFTGINSITADAARCNQPFNYTDANPLAGINYYRLKMTAADGKVSYSSIVALLNAVKGFELVSIAPNPVVTGKFKLNVASAQAGKMEMAVFDMQGRMVNRQQVSLIAGFNSIPVNVNYLAHGTYSIYGIIGNDRSRTMRFVKQ